MQEASCVQQLNLCICILINSGFFNGGEEKDTILRILMRLLYFFSPVKAMSDTNQRIFCTPSVWRGCSNTENCTNLLLIIQYLKFDTPDRLKLATKPQQYLIFFLYILYEQFQITLLCPADSRLLSNCHRCNLSSSFVSLQQLRPYWQSQCASRLKREGTMESVIKGLKINRVFFFFFFSLSFSVSPISLPFIRTQMDFFFIRVNLQECLETRLA